MVNHRYHDTLVYVLWFYTYTKPLTLRIQHTELVCTRWKSSILSFRPNTLVIVSPIREVRCSWYGCWSAPRTNSTYNYGSVTLSVLYIYTVAYVFHMLCLSYLPRDPGVYFRNYADSNLLPYSLTFVDLFVERCCRCIV